MNRRGIILLVDDNPDDVELTLRAFQRNRIANEIVVAGDGEQALAWLFDGIPVDGGVRRLRPDVVLLDLNLPKIGGLEVLRRLRADARTRRLPIVVLTSSKEERDVVSSYELGANSFVRKPVDFAQFVTAASQLGVYWLAINENPDGE